jgi:hypothetical protein
MADRRLLHSVSSLDVRDPIRIERTARDERDAERIRKDIETRRYHLAENVAELRDAVSEKLDLRKRAEDTLALGKARAAMMIDRARVRVSRRPGLFAALALATISLAVLAIAAHQRARPPRWVRRIQDYRRALAQGIEVRIGNPDAR